MTTNLANKPIILLGGASGTGKSILANRILHELHLDHRVGTGFVRAIVQSETDPSRDPALFSMTFQADDPIAHIRWQAARLQPAVMACIKRARLEGTSLVIEGTHLLPELYHDAPVTGYIVLRAHDVAEHTRRILGDTHTERTVTEADVERIRAIDRYYASEAARCNVPAVVSGENIAEILSLVTHDHPVL